MQKLVYYSLILFFGLVWLGACNPSPHNLPKAQKGKIDLSNWDLIKNIRLDGEWEFYWQRLLHPADFSRSTQVIDNQYINVPISWTTMRDKNAQTYPAYSYATYRLEVKLPQKYPRLGIYIPKVWSAIKVWVNGNLVYTAGKISTKYEGYENQILEKIIELDTSSDKLEVIVQVANFDMFIAGIVQSFELEAFTSLNETTSLVYTRTLMWLGALLIMAGYHFILYIFRRKNISVLYFGIICLLLAIRLVIFGEHYLYEYLKEHTDWLSYALQSRLYYSITFSLIPLALIYVQSLYPDKVKTLFIRISAGITALYLSFILITSPHIFIPTIIPYQVIVGLFVLYLLIALLRAYWTRQEDSLWQMVGIITMVIAGINDSLQAEGINIFDEFELMPTAFGIFLLLQFAILARRFSRAFKEVEDLSENLEKKVVERTLELTQKKEEIEQKKLKLEEAYQQIKDSVVYASRIQKAILADIDELKKHFAEAFIFFQPRDIVSGDFYWFASIENPLFVEKAKILIVADCTGHGVPGALMTVMGNDFLNEIIIKEQILAPAQIIYELDKRITHTLNKQSHNNQQNDGMDIAIILLDEVKKTLIFAGAKNSLYQVRNGEMKEIKGSIFPIGSNQFKMEKVFESYTLSVEIGDMYYMSSDGFQDQFSKIQNKKYLRKRFREFLHSISRLSVQEQRQILENEFVSWRGEASQTDDVLVAGLRIQ